jgi:ribose 5-phosphate isomerase B
MAIVANKFPNARAVQPNDLYTAIMSRKHNDTNVLTLAGRVTGNDLAKEIVKTWLETPFEGRRYERRMRNRGILRKIKKIRKSKTFLKKL